MIRVAIAGKGRMGQAIAASIEQQDDMTLVGHWGRGDTLDALLTNCDVLIDFSLPEATTELLNAVVQHNKPLVCGVSGLSAPQMREIDAAADAVPLLYDRNMSLGVAVLERSVREAAAALGPDYEIAISEVHHVHKKDAPSGTALQLGEAAAAARGDDGTEHIEFSSERRGEVPGDHEVTMTSPTERLTFAHSVTTRQVFAAGAVRAARWIVQQQPGRYAMQDVLFEN